MGDRQITLEEEELLVRQAIRGDGEAFGRIYDAHRDFLYSAVIYPRVGSADAAEEVLSETFLLALKKLPSFEWRGKSVKHWLQSIAMNKTLEWSARRRKEPVYDESFLDFVPDATYQPEKHALLKDYRAQLKSRTNEIMNAIQERYRRAIELRLEKKLTREECAREMEVTVATFDVLFFRACRSFREAYRKKYGKI